MKTDYFCNKCNVSFSESKLPNINRTHFCGDIARVTEFSDEGESAVEEESHGH